MAALLQRSLNLSVDQNFVSFLAETKKNGIPIPNFLSVAAVSQKIQIDFSGSYSKSDFVYEEKLVTKQVNCWGAALYKGSILASHPAAPDSNHRLRQYFFSLLLSL